MRGPVSAFQAGRSITAAWPAGALCGVRGAPAVQAAVIAGQVHRDARAAVRGRYERRAARAAERVDDQGRADGRVRLRAGARIAGDGGAYAPVPGPVTAPFVVAAG